MTGLAKGYYPFEDAQERERLDGLLRRMAQFFCVQIGFHAYMGNHFHLVLEMLRLELSDSEVQLRWELYYAEAIARGKPRPDWSQPDAIKAARKRMESLSSFLHDLKGQFAADYNFRHERRGAFWSDRYANTLLDAPALAACARYVELNPLRAGIESQVGASGRNSWHNFQATPQGQAGDLRAHSGFPLLLRALHPDDAEQLSPAEQLELALKTHANWQEHFAAEERRVAAEAAATQQERDERHAAQVAVSRRRPWHQALAVGSRRLCQQQAAAQGRPESDILEIEPGLFGLFRRPRSRV